ncbi:hypothetical protein M406DRAFT_106797 [Cryphonectria parasitica EP155]|uniref:Uncharacterized protein n=1 Tax=Cryphonectria parasitica (strain ATCC 38755 / EP155) TaxID=660469 RepID=A0A9P4Y6N9_CRYP1|nr:uncharacterized protein M406DRAFT_106797 [Cryphonectria parasitica EP155]KAF3767917.1 hypothetical protein M406DRAFT_106797 [Cryphonectria parasitica EP155]
MAPIAPTTPAAASTPSGHGHGAASGAARGGQNLSCPGERADSRHQYKSTDPLPSQIVSDIATTTAVPPADPQPSTPSFTLPSSSPSARVLGSSTRGFNGPNEGGGQPRASPSPGLTSPRQDAPGIGSPSLGFRPSSGFPSPGRDQSHANPKFADDRTRITYAIQQAIPEAARRSVRDCWEKALLGSDFHQAFVLNASIHHATPSALQRGMRDFGTNMIRAAKREIVDAMTPADLDEVAALILAKASDSFLDQALERRLKTIEAKRLINALARAERLGYEPSDVEEEEAADAGPSASSTGPYPYPAAPEQSQPLPSQAVAVTPPPAGLPFQEPNLSTNVLYCGLCFRRFGHASAYNYHLKYKVCTRTPNGSSGFKYNCQHCGQGLTTGMALQYHNFHKICGDFDDKPSSADSASTPVPASQPPPSVLNTNDMNTPGTPSASRTASPAQRSMGAATSKVGTPTGATPRGSSADPYSHLSPEQLATMQEELRAAELKYGERMRDANTYSDEASKRARLDSLCNSFATKQSLIRKKYGVRLRMRRTKAEILAEKDRIHYKTPAELQAELGFPLRERGRPPIVDDPSERDNTPGKKSGDDYAVHDVEHGGWAAVNAPARPVTTLASSLPVPQLNVENNEGGVGMHAGKRRYSGHGEDLSSKRTAYSEMGGLGSSAAVQAETRDPTFAPSKALSPEGNGTAEEPLELNDTDTEDSDGDSTSEDIPAQLPTSLRDSLQRSSSVTISRPASGSAAP